MGIGDDARGLSTLRSNVDNESPQWHGAVQHGSLSHYLAIIRSISKVNYEGHLGYQ